MKQAVWYVLISCIVMNGAVAQDLPVGPNKVDASGQRQGVWITYFTKDWQETNQKESVFYYNKITFENGKAQGNMFNYFLNGSPFSKCEADKGIIGLCIWYDSVGAPKACAFYENNKTLKDWMYEYKKKGDYKNAESYGVREMDIQAKVLGKERIGYANSCSDLAQLYYDQNLYSQAAPLFQDALAINEKLFGKEHPSYAIACNNLAMLYYKEGRYPEAEHLFQEVMAIYAKELGKKHPEYATVCINLANMYKDQHLFAKAESLYVEAKAIRGDVLGMEHPSYATACTNLANLYAEEGLYSKAEPLYLEGKAIREKVLGKESPEYGSSCNSLALLYQNLGLYAKAEPLFLEAKAIHTKVLGKEYPAYATICANLATLYEDQGLYAKAEPLFLESMGINEKVLGKEHLTYAISCTSLATLYNLEGLYAKAEPLFLEAKAVNEKHSEKGHRAYAVSCDNLGSFYRDRGEYAKSEPLFLEAMAVKEKAFGKIHLEYAVSCNNLALLYDKQGQYAKAEPLYIEAKTTVEKASGFENPIHATYCSNLAFMYYEQGLYAKAEPLYYEAMQNRQIQIEIVLPTLSEKEKQAYLKSIDRILYYYTLLALDYYNQKPSISGELYDIILATKGVSSSSGQKTRYYIEKKGNQSLTTLYGQWRDQNEYLVRVWQMSVPALHKQAINTIKEEEMATILERTVSQKAKKNMHHHKVTWHDVKAKLKPKEAAIEVTRVVKQSGSDKKKIDTVYAVLIIYGQPQKQPELLEIKNGSYLEHKGIKYYHNCIKRKVEDNASFQGFWSEIGGKLTSKGVDKVYFSGDGVYHQLNLQTLRNPTSKKYLGDELEIQLIGSSEDVVTLADSKKGGSTQVQDTTLYLFGDPNYAGDTTTLQPKENDEPTPVFQYAASIDTSQHFISGSGKVSMLPGTEKEVTNIGDLARNQQIKTEVYVELTASESNLKTIENPFILHIATHGFFLEDVTIREGQERIMGMQMKKAKENPLLRSGLLFENCEKSLQGKQNGEDEDGILSAQEATSLHLDETELVILSACEIGFGEIKDGEGVHGLQSSFRQAGASTVLMSLWAVSDEATNMLMTEFYDNLFTKKKSKREAFKQAQTSLRETFKEPFYWGAFVMVGE